MRSDDRGYELPELSDLAEVSPRTVRYYIQQGLLDPPESRGPAARYGPEHLDRLRLIKRLQREHLPLAEIRRRLEELSPEEVHELVARPAEGSGSSARDYVQSVLRGRAHESQPAMRPFASSPAPHPQAPGKRSQWDRLTLAPDVELHVRRPLSREQNRRVERLIEAARDIFEETEP